MGMIWVTIWVIGDINLLAAPADSASAGPHLVPARLYHQRGKGWKYEI